MEDKKTRKQPSLNTEEQQPPKQIKHPQKPNKQTSGPAKAIKQNKNNTPITNPKEPNKKGRKKNQTTPMTTKQKQKRTKAPG